MSIVVMYNFSYDHPDVISGQGTVGLEIAEQVPDVDACVVPVGGGGLIAGVATALKTLKPGIQIYVSVVDIQYRLQEWRCMSWMW